MTKNSNVPTACGWSPDKKLKNLMHERHLMVGPVIDLKVQKFMVSLYKKSSQVSHSIAATTALVLLSITADESVKTVVATST